MSWVPLVTVPFCFHSLSVSAFYSPRWQSNLPKNQRSLQLLTSWESLHHVGQWSRGWDAAELTQSVCVWHPLARGGGGLHVWQRSKTCHLGSDLSVAFLFLATKDQWATINTLKNNNKFSKKRYYDLSLYLNKNKNTFWLLRFCIVRSQIGLSSKVLSSSRGWLFFKDGHLHWGKVTTDLEMHFSSLFFHNCPRPFCYQISVLPLCSPLSSSLPSFWSSGEALLSYITYLHGRTLMSDTGLGFSGGSAGDWFEGVWGLFFPNPNILRRLISIERNWEHFRQRSMLV